MAIVVEAALGAAFGELLKAVFYDFGKVVKFKSTLEKLQSILVQISPHIQQIENLNNELGRTKEELEPLIAKMEKGTQLVRKCLKIRKRYSLVKAYSYQKQLDSLAQDLATFFKINMPLIVARDQKEILVKIETLLVERDYLPMDKNPVRSPIIGDQYCRASSPMLEIVRTVENFGPMDTNPVRSPIIGDQYCRASSPMLEIVRTVENFGFSEKFEVRDASQVIFHLKIPSISIHRRYTLFDYQGNPIITLHHRRMRAHHRWEVYRGEETNELLFNIKRNRIIHGEVILKVFLAENNSDETKSDFIVKGNRSHGPCYVHAAQARDFIAQVGNKYNAAAKIGSSKQSVVVREMKPNVDFAFIVALFVVILSL